MKKEKNKQVLPEIYASGKKIYTPPALEVILIEMEHGFAATSASLNPGDAGSPNTPQVEDWNDGGSLGGKDFDL
ncbi:hypothetical protein BAZ12_08195 [Elizabethkingia miricola]|uniref:Uncharacterized protein n=1 Tax=Elizabethkingia miricola TaxID=172045 RepID=A0AAP1BX19_ELIMR|nr:MULTISPECIES: hypothetical protein [Elizabethkingia]KUY15919.1 hypothetical protein ATB95_17725 [Elizabethkingia miricola]MCL1652341.1 hypothetical protein [Elizabethkingia miricola]MCL1679899.1 hypothetical protein [Elizabethkingia miricola]MCP1251375.1 hypothetical protein [Elizabethkingia sp. S0634]OPC38584.1 hypothetical protein BAX99_16285 [Elizabethkingia miricola]